MADVLSPRTIRHGKDSFSSFDSRNSKSTETAIPKNSRTLLTVSSPRKLQSMGILTRQALPEKVYPPSPKGQESDHAKRVGVLVTRRLIDIPLLATLRYSSQRCRSSTSSLVNLTICRALLRLVVWLFCRISFRKCRLSGMR